MKKAKKYFSGDLYEDGDYNWYTILDAIKKAQKDAYNQALSDARNHDKVDVYYDENVGYCISQQSILKLKK